MPVLALVVTDLEPRAVDFGCACHPVSPPIRTSNIHRTSFMFILCVGGGGGEMGYFGAIFLGSLGLGTGGGGGGRASYRDYTF